MNYFVINSYNFSNFKFVDLPYLLVLRRFELLHYNSKNINVIVTNVTIIIKSEFPRGC